MLHSARQDLEVIFQLTGRMPPRLIDTQVAAALTGYPPQVGLEGLLKRTLDVELGESFARTDWSRRPLPDAALRYALDDVRYLLAAWERVDAELDRLGRREWLREDCQRMLAEQPVADTTAVWSRLKGVHGLPFASQCAALALVRWRETAAQRSDRPRRWLLADEALLAIAATLPRDAEALAALAESKFIARSAPAISAAMSSRNDAELQAEVRANAMQAVPDKATRQVSARARAPARRRPRHGARDSRDEARPRRRRLATTLPRICAPAGVRKSWRQSWRRNRVCPRTSRKARSTSGRGRS